MLTTAADGIKELSQENPSKGIVDHKTKEFIKILEVLYMFCTCSRHPSTILILRALVLTGIIVYPLTTQEDSL